MRESGNSSRPEYVGGLGLKVVLVSLLWAFAVHPGVLDSKGMPERLQMAHAWWRGISEELPEDSVVSDDRSHESSLAETADATTAHSKFRQPWDVGLSAMMLPADWLGTKVGETFESANARELTRHFAVSFLFFAPLLALAVASLIWLLGLLEVPETARCSAALVWILGTGLLSSYQNDPEVIALLVLVAASLGSWLRAMQDRHFAWALLSGQLLGAAILVNSLLLVPALILLVAMLAMPSERDARNFVKSLGAWFLGFLPVVFLELFLSFLRQGSWIPLPLAKYFGSASQAHPLNGFLLGKPWQYEFLLPVGIVFFVAFGRNASRGRWVLCGGLILSALVTWVLFPGESQITMFELLLLIPILLSGMFSELPLSVRTQDMRWSAEAMRKPFQAVLIASIAVHAVMLALPGSPAASSEYFGLLRERVSSLHDAGTNLGAALDPSRIFSMGSRPQAFPSLKGTSVTFRFMPYNYAQIAKRRAPELAPSLLFLLGGWLLTLLLAVHSSFLIFGFIQRAKKPRSLLAG